MAHLIRGGPATARRVASGRDRIVLLERDGVSRIFRSRVQ
jgi:hypothetical protein